MLVFWIRICMVLGLLDPDLLVRGMNPDPTSKIVRKGWFLLLCDIFLTFYPVFRIYDILCGSGSADPWLWPTDPDPDADRDFAISVTDPEPKKLITKIPPLEGTPTPLFEAKKRQKKSQNSKNQFFTILLDNTRMTEGFWSRAGSGSTPLTYRWLMDLDPGCPKTCGSGFGS